MERCLLAIAAILVMLWAFAGCDREITIEDETPDVVAIVQEIWHTTVEEIWHTTTVTILEEDSTPDVVEHWHFEYPSGPVPCLALKEGGVPAMADSPLDGLAVATSLGSADVLHVLQGGTDKQIAPAAAFGTYFPPNYIYGLICSPDADYDADVNVTAGGAMDATNADPMILASEITKQLDAAWAVGDDQGGLDTGAVAMNTLYAIWLIKRSDTGIVDVLFSTSFTAPTMPTNYDEKRLIGAVRTDNAADIIFFRQAGDYFAYLGDDATKPPLDVNDNTIVDATWETGTLSVPPHAIADVVCVLNNTGETALVGELFIRAIGRASGTVSNDYLALSQELAAGAFRKVGGRARVAVDGSSQFEYAARETAGTANVFVFTHGFLMTTRRDPQ